MKYSPYMLFTDSIFIRPVSYANLRAIFPGKADTVQTPMNKNDTSDMNLC